MNERIRKELDAMVEVLVETGIVTKIILFGSQACGEETPDSDIDLCVLTTVRDRHPIDVGVDLRIKLYEIQETPLDLLAYNQDEFFFHAERPTSFENHIVREGMTLYEHRRELTSYIF